MKAFKLLLQGIKCIGTGIFWVGNKISNDLWLSISVSIIAACIWGAVYG